MLWFCEAKPILLPSRILKVFIGANRPVPGRCTVCLGEPRRCDNKKQRPQTRKPRPGHQPRGHARQHVLQQDRLCELAQGQHERSYARVVLDLRHKTVGPQKNQNKQEVEPESTDSSAGAFWKKSADPSIVPAASARSPAWPPWTGTSGGTGTGGPNRRCSLSHRRKACRAGP